MEEETLRHSFPCRAGHGDPDCLCWQKLDLQEHKTNGDSCWCGPEYVEIIGSDVKLVRHKDAS